jgi:preprotein translocase subunit SecB
MKKKMATTKPLAQPMISPLQLDRYFLKELHFALRPGYEEGIVPPRNEIDIPSVDIGVMAMERNPDNPRQWMFEVLVNLLDPDTGKFPYKVQATMVGFFTVSDRYPAERVERLAKTNGPALLYSSAREIIAFATGCSPYPQLTIPAVTFIQPEKAIAVGKGQHQLTAAPNLPAKKGSKKSTAKKK